MKIAVIGTGYVGLVTGACFADTGNDVYCVDQDEKKIASLKQGQIPIYEPGLDALVERGVAQKRLHFTTSKKEAVAGADVVFLAVQTPSLPNGDPNMTYVETAAKEVAQAMTGDCIIVNKSTVPVGTSLKTREWISSQTKHRFDVVSNPEFLKEGSAVQDFLKPDRVVIGALQKEAFEKMEELYAPFVRQGNPILRMDPISAELTKYACNAFLATRISFMNELSWLCEKVGADIEDIRKGMATDVRIGKHFLYAGAGYGGSCFPKDVKALISTARSQDIPVRIAEATEAANARQKTFLAKKVKEHFGSVNGKTFAVWGLAFKPNTDDMREAPALVLIDELRKSGAKVKTFDPVAMDRAKEILGEDSITYTENAMEALTGADALILVTEWNEFRNIDFKNLKSQLKTPVIFDGRNVYDPKKMKELGLTYYGVGRRSV